MGYIQPNFNRKGHPPFSSISRKRISLGKTYKHWKGRATIICHQCFNQNNLLTHAMLLQGDAKRVGFLRVDRTLLGENDRMICSLTKRYQTIDICEFKNYIYVCVHKHHQYVCRLSMDNCMNVTSYMKHIS